MSWKRAKTPGWAAFDPNKQQKQVTDDETHNDPYPPISSNISTWHHSQKPSRNVDLTGRSFSSVLTHSSSLPDMMASDIQKVPITLMENSHIERVIANSKENNVSQVYEKLKELHPWADENLLEDIVATVDNDIDKAASLLKEMTSPGRLQEKKEAEFQHNIEELLDDHGLSGKVLGNDNDNVSLRLIIDSLSMIPVEPEWEDDDMYIMHRKEAIRAMRSASRYSKAAKEAYLRRDHTTAQELSVKAREEWSASERLNAKAAKEILAIRNCENGDWKLDLHGLHASEAVQVLQEHLLKIESQVSGIRSDRQQHQSSKPRLLEVITGKGNHSRGQAALPTAIKSFLSEKRYYYYEARIGVITVQPKFRQLLTALSNT